MLKSDRFYSSTSSLLAGVILIVIGLCMILGQDKLYFDFVNMFIMVIFVLGIIQFIRYFVNRQKKTERKITFTRSFFYLLFCLIVVWFPEIPMSILPLLFANYLILNGAIKLISYIILLKEKTTGHLKELFMSLLYFGFGIPLLISPLSNISTMLLVMGIYVILLGITFVMDFINSILPRRFKNSFRRRIKITLPVLLEAIIPYQVLNEINYFINHDEDEKIVYQEKNSDVTPDMEIFVHVSMRGFNRFGHVDICIGDKVISYGNYDDSSIKFNSIGDGVLFVTDKKNYIPFCIKHSHKTIIGFGLKLTDSQNERIRTYIEGLFQNVYEWNSPLEEELKNKKKVNEEKFGDYASCLYKATKADFYKFKTGRFKKYFVLGVNCCLLADSIIGKSGTDILKLNGIITPGTYYEYLNREFKKKNSMVIMKNIYNAESTGVKKSKTKKFFEGFSK